MPKKSNGSGKKKPPKLQVVKPHPPEKPIASEKPIVEKLEHAPKPPPVKITLPKIEFKPEPIIVKPTETPKSEPVKIKPSAEHTHAKRQLIQPQDAKGISVIEVFVYAFIAFIIGTVLGMIAASPSSIF